MSSTMSLCGIRLPGRAFAQLRNELPLVLQDPMYGTPRSTLADNSTLDLKIAWLLPELPPSVIRMEGPLGQLQFNCATGQGSCRIGTETTVLALKPLAPEWKRQYDGFAEAIEQGRETFATLYDGLRALEVTAACEVSAQVGSAITPTELELHTGCIRVDAPHGTAIRKRPMAGRSDRTTLGGRLTERQHD